jgi:TonB family protein
LFGCFAPASVRYVSAGDATAASWPAADSVTTNYEPTEFHDVYLGAGGEVRRVQGIDIWESGRPARMNRELGTVHVVVAATTSKSPAVWTTDEFFAYSEGAVAKLAAAAGGNAVVLTDVAKDERGATHFGYRVSAYLAEGDRTEGPVLFDEAIKDADGNRAPNGTSTGIRITRAVNFGHHLIKVVPEPGIRGPGPRVSGNVLAKLCVGADKQVTDASVVKSSGSEILDIAAMGLTKGSRYEPATVHGRPVASCEYVRYVWKPY